MSEHVVSVCVSRSGSMCGWYSAGGGVVGGGAVVCGAMWPYLVVAGVALSCYSNALFGEFVHDDIVAVTRNPDVLGTSSVLQLLGNDFWGTPLSDPRSHKSYRPLTTLSFRYHFSSRNWLYLHGLWVLLYHNTEWQNKLFFLSKHFKVNLVNNFNFTNTLTKIVKGNYLFPNILFVSSNADLCTLLFSVDVCNIYF